MLKNPVFSWVKVSYSSSLIFLSFMNTFLKSNWKVILQRFNLNYILMIFFFSKPLRDSLMYKNQTHSYIFVVNYQFFEITPSGCALWTRKSTCLITWKILFETPFFRYLSMYVPLIFMNTWFFTRIHEDSDMSSLHTSAGEVHDRTDIWKTWFIK